MADVYWLAIAALATLLGMGLLALSLDVHWRQIVEAKHERASTAPSSRLRSIGAVSLAAALFFCLVADHASMAVLVWVMLLAASAVVIAMLLTWRPQWLHPLTLPWTGSVRPARRL